MTYYGQVVETDGELQGHTRHYSYHQLKYHNFSFQFLRILPENIDFIGKAEKIGKLPKILLDLETEKNIYGSAICACCNCLLSKVKELPLTMQVVI